MSDLVTFQKFEKITAILMAKVRKLSGEAGLTDNVKARLFSKSAVTQSNQDDGSPLQYCHESEVTR